MTAAQVGYFCGAFLMQLLVAAIVLITAKTMKAPPAPSYAVAAFMGLVPAVLAWAGGGDLWIGLAVWLLLAAVLYWQYRRAVKIAARK